jgi:hypothetical protein
VVFFRWVPDLTRHTDIKLNERVSLRRREDRILSYHRKIPPDPSPQLAKSSGDHIPLGGFVLKGSPALQISDGRPNGFAIICRACEGLGITFECAEGAPSSTPISCRHCGAPRGTLGDLRSLSTSGKKDHAFDI